MVWSDCTRIGGQGINEDCTIVASIQLQYQAMGLCDSYEEDSPLRAVTSSEEAIKLFDDPTYILGGEQNRKRVWDVRIVFVYTPTLYHTIKWNLVTRS